MSTWVGLGFGLIGLTIGGMVLWLLLQLLAQNGRLLTRLDGVEQRLAAVSGNGALPTPAATPEPAAGLPVGTPAPAFQLPGLHGEVLTLESLRASGKPTLLAFLDPGCGPCNALLPDMARWQRELAGTVVLAVLSRGSADDNRAKAVEFGLAPVLLQQDREVATAYLATGTPSMVLVRPDGTIGSPLAAGAEQIRALVARTMGTPATPSPIIPVLPAAPSDSQPRQPCPRCGRVHAEAEAAAAAAVEGLPLGTPAPALRLPDLDGTPVDLADLRGQPTLVAFWNPSCGFCQQLLPDLKAWEAASPPGSPRLLVVSTGDPAANRALGFRSPVVLDEAFATGSAFGASGTPSAVLVDGEGRIASALAVGGPGVLALARSEQPAPVPAPPAPAAAIGQAAPALRLPDLDGREVDLADYRGRETVLLFWNPGCGFCQQMLPDLKVWEANRPAGAPALLIVSSGAPEAIAAQGLASTVLVDASFTVGPAFGANGTPMAVRIDAAGSVASALAAGAEAVFGLLGGRVRA